MLGQCAFVTVDPPSSLIAKKCRDPPLIEPGSRSDELLTVIECGLGQPHAERVRYSDELVFPDTPNGSQGIGLSDDWVWNFDLPDALIK